jgi:cobalt transporter subunit CbtB
MSALLKSASIAGIHREGLRYGVLAILLGLLFIGIAGFAHPDALHNAAHNTRHAIAFPCH